MNFYAKVFHALREGNTRFSGYERGARIEESGEALPGEGAPVLVADIPDDNSKVLPTARKLCGQCAVLNPPGSRLCNKCGHNLTSCHACGYVPEDDSSFCIKCGTKLD